MDNPEIPVVTDDSGTVRRVPYAAVLSVITATTEALVAIADAPEELITDVAGPLDVLRTMTVQAGEQMHAGDTTGAGHTLNLAAELIDTLRKATAVRWGRG